MNELLDQDQDLGFPLGKGQGKNNLQPSALHYLTRKQAISYPIDYTQSPWALLIILASSTTERDCKTCIKTARLNVEIKLVCHKILFGCNHNNGAACSNSQFDTYCQK